MNCPHCGKPIQTQQSRAATSQWSKMTKAERSTEMSKRRLKGMVQKAYDTTQGTQALVKAIEKRLKQPSEA